MNKILVLLTAVVMRALSTVLAQDFCERNFGGSYIKSTNYLPCANV